jgi:hypothetical protein
MPRCSVLVELRRQAAHEMVEHQPDTARGPGLSMHDQPHFPFELECLFEHSDELGLPPSQMYVMSADACSVAERGELHRSTVAPKAEVFPSQLCRSPSSGAF